MLATTHTNLNSRRLETSAFTMAEVMVVVVVISIFAGMIIPVLASRLSTYELRQTALSLRLLGDEGRTLAMRLKVPVYLRISQEERKAWLEPVFEEDGFPVMRRPTGTAKHVSWTKRIELGRIDVTEKQTEALPEKMTDGICFLPDMSATAASVEFMQADRPERKWTILIDGVTAACQAWVGERDKPAVWRMDLDA